MTPIKRIKHSGCQALIKLSDPRCSSRPLRADATRNRGAILGAAEITLVSDGPAFSTETVAKRAGVGVGTVFRHFPTKEALLEAVLVNRLNLLTEHAKAIEQSLDDHGEALFAFLEHIVEQAARKRALTYSLAALGVDVARLLDVSGGEFRATISNLLCRAQKRGVVRDDIEPADILNLLLALAHAADQGKWQSHAQRRTLMVIVDGLRCKRVT